MYSAAMTQMHRFTTKIVIAAGLPDEALRYAARSACS